MAENPEKQIPWKCRLEISKFNYCPFNNQPMCLSLRANGGNVSLQYFAGRHINIRKFCHFCAFAIKSKIRAQYISVVLFGLFTVRGVVISGDSNRVFLKVKSK